MMPDAGQRIGGRFLSLRSTRELDIPHANEPKTSAEGVLLSPIRLNDCSSVKPGTTSVSAGPQRRQRAGVKTLR